MTIGLDRVGGTVGLEVDGRACLAPGGVIFAPVALRLMCGRVTAGGGCSSLPFPLVSVSGVVAVVVGVASPTGGLACIAASAYVRAAGVSNSLPLPLLSRGGAAGSVSVDASVVGSDVPVAASNHQFSHVPSLFLDRGFTIVS